MFTQTTDGQRWVITTRVPTKRAQYCNTNKHAAAVSVCFSIVCMPLIYDNHEITHEASNSRTVVRTKPYVVSSSFSSSSQTVFGRRNGLEEGGGGFKRGSSSPLLALWLLFWFYQDIDRASCPTPLDHTVTNTVYI